MPSYLGNFPNTQTFGKFPKYLVIREISKILKSYCPQISLGIWEIWRITQMPGKQGNFQNDWESGEFPKFLGESEGNLFFKYRKFHKYPDV